MRAVLVALLLCAACGNDSSATTTPTPPTTSRQDAAAPPSPLVVANWNVEWFGSPTEGPTDETLQQANVAKVMRSMEADVWAVQEIVDVDAFHALGTAVGDYEALASSESPVEAGSAVYQAPGGLKLGVLYRPERIELRAARVVLKENLDPFNGRAPLELDLATKPGGTLLTLVVVHLSPGTDAASYDKRKAAAGLLKTHLDGKPEGALVLVAGDFNDGLERSSYQGSASPFAPLLEDPAYRFTTRGLESPRYPRVIDHQLATDDLAASFVTGTAKVVNGDTVVSRFVDTTSDHDPVIARYDVP